MKLFINFYKQLILNCIFLGVYSRTDDITDPADTEAVGSGGREIREHKVDRKERLIDDGVHLPDLGANPANVPTDGCAIYTKSDGTDEEVYIKDSAANVIQITKGGYAPVAVHGARATLVGNFDVVSGVETLLPLATETFDIGGDYDNTAGNYKFVIPADGYYQFNVKIRWGEHFNAGDIGRIILKKNAVAYQYSWLAYSSYYLISAFSGMDFFNAADFLQVYVEHDYGANRQVSSSSTYFDVYKVG